LDNNMSIDGWKGRIKRLQESTNMQKLSISERNQGKIRKTVILEVQLFCDNTKHEGEHYLTTGTTFHRNFQPEEGMPIYEALRQFRQGDIIFVTGKRINSSWGNFIFEGIGRTADESKNVAEVQRGERK